jgi:hypothetical protein
VKKTKDPVFPTTIVAGFWVAQMARPLYFYSLAVPCTGCCFIGPNPSPTAPSLVLFYYYYYFLFFLKKYIMGGGGAIKLFLKS